MRGLLRRFLHFFFLSLWVFSFAAHYFSRKDKVYINTALWNEARAVLWLLTVISPENGKDFPSSKPILSFPLFSFPTAGCHVHKTINTALVSVWCEMGNSQALNSAILKSKHHPGEHGGRKPSIALRMSCDNNSSVGSDGSGEQQQRYGGFRRKRANPLADSAGSRNNCADNRDESARRCGGVVAMAGAGSRGGRPPSSDYSFDLSHGSNRSGKRFYANNKAHGSYWVMFEENSRVCDRFIFWFSPGTNFDGKLFFSEKKNCFFLKKICFFLKKNLFFFLKKNSKK